MYKLDQISIKYKCKSSQKLCYRDFYNTHNTHDKFKNAVIYKRNGGGGKIRTYVDFRRQIYSLLPLTARPPLREIVR